MSRLNVKIGNVSFINPFILASGPPTRNAEMIARAFKQGWGGAVIKTVCLNYQKMVNTSPRLVKLENGLQNIEMISNRSPDDWCEDIKLLKNNYPENIIIASIAAEAKSFDDWKKLALMMQDAGADILELNLSCPHGLPEMDMGNSCSDVPEIAGAIIKAVKEVSEIPVWAKLSPNVTSIKQLAVICRQNGADGITAINTVKGFAGIDINTGIPKLNISGNSAYGGISGELIKPIALKAVSEISATLDCPVSATGGVRTWQDAVEFVLLGASTVQFCTEVMMKGYGLINSLKQGLSDYILDKDHCSLDEIRGKSIKYIKELTELNKSKNLVPVFEKETCIKCRKCFVACRDSGCQAIMLSNEGYPVVYEQKCVGCGLCMENCPTKSIMK